MARKKKIGEKIAEVVDHIIHPHASEPKVEDEQVETKELDKSEDEVVAPRLNQESDLNNHPKFDKFKKHGGNIND